MEQFKIGTGNRTLKNPGFNQNISHAMQEFLNRRYRKILSPSCWQCIFQAGNIRYFAVLGVEILTSGLEGITGNSWSIRRQKSAFEDDFITAAHWWCQMILRWSTIEAKIDIPLHAWRKCETAIRRKELVSRRWQSHCSVNTPHYSRNHNILTRNIRRGEKWMKLDNRTSSDLEPVWRWGNIQYFKGWDAASYLGGIEALVFIKLLNRGDKISRLILSYWVSNYRDKGEAGCELKEIFLQSGD